MIAGLLGGLLWVVAEGGDPLAALPPPAAGTVRVYVVRHGQALMNLSPPPKLSPDALDHLTDLGREQARAAGNALAGRGVTLVLSSPARRARETSAEIRAALDRPVLRVEPDLRPMEQGRSSTGMGRDRTPPGGESLEQVGRRVGAMAARLARRGHRGAVVFVAHAEVIGAFLGQVQGVRNGSISVVDVPAAGPPRVLLTDHLPEPAAAPVR
jgi:broad specificity phosphatase PhoE